MSKFILTMALLIGAAAAADDVKQDFKKTGKDIKQTAKDVGHKVKDAAKEVGHGFKRGWKKITGKKDDALKK